MTSIHSSAELLFIFGIIIVSGVGVHAPHATAYDDQRLPDDRPTPADARLDAITRDQVDTLDASAITGFGASASVHVVDASASAGANIPTGVDTSIASADATSAGENTSASHGYSQVNPGVVSVGDGVSISVDYGPPQDITGADASASDGTGADANGAASTGTSVSGGASADTSGNDNAITGTSAIDGASIDTSANDHASTSANVNDGIGTSSATSVGASANDGMSTGESIGYGHRPDITGSGTSAAAGVDADANVDKSAAENTSADANTNGDEDGAKSADSEANSVDDSSHGNRPHESVANGGDSEEDGDFANATAESRDEDGVATFARIIVESGAILFVIDGLVWMAIFVIRVGLSCAAMEMPWRALRMLYNDDVQITRFRKMPPTPLEAATTSASEDIAIAAVAHSNKSGSSYKHYVVKARGLERLAGVDAIVRVLTCAATTATCALAPLIAIAVDPALSSIRRALDHDAQASDQLRTSRETHVAGDIASAESDIIGGMALSAIVSALVSLAALRSKGAAAALAFPDARLSRAVHASQSIAVEAPRTCRQWWKSIRQWPRKTIRPPLGSDETPDEKLVSRLCAPDTSGRELAQASVRIRTGSDAQRADGAGVLDGVCPGSPVYNRPRNGNVATVAVAQPRQGICSDGSTSVGRTATTVSDEWQDDCDRSHDDPRAAGVVGWATDILAARTERTEIVVASVMHAIGLALLALVAHAIGSVAAASHVAVGEALHDAVAASTYIAYVAAASQFAAAELCLLGTTANPSRGLDVQLWAWRKQTPPMSAAISLAAAVVATLVASTFAPACVSPAAPTMVFVAAAMAAAFSAWACALASPRCIDRLAVPIVAWAAALPINITGSFSTAALALAAATHASTSI